MSERQLVHLVAAPGGATGAAGLGLTACGGGTAEGKAKLHLEA